MSKRDIHFTFQDSIQFSGKLICGSIDVPVENVKIEIEKYHYLNDMTFLLHFRSSDLSSVRSMLKAGGNRFNIVGLIHGEITISATAYWTKYEASSLYGVVTELQISCDPLRSVPGKQYVRAYISSTNLALPEVDNVVFHWTGEIKPMDTDKVEYINPIVFPTELGEAKFTLQYDFESTHVEDYYLDVRIPRPVISIDIEKNLLNKNVLELIEKFRDELNPIEIILSFLSRRQIRWYEIDLISADFSDSERVIESNLIRKGFSTPKPVNALVNPYRLESKLCISGMVDELKSSRYKEPIEHAVNYLNGVWDDRTVESIVTTTFTAFETIINGISDKDGDYNIIDNDDFNALRKILEKKIKEYCVQNKMGSNVRSEIYRKLPEIQRSAILPRALKILKRYDVYYFDIASNESDLAEWLAEVYKQRSMLVHAGRVADIIHLGQESYRIHAITERLIYKMIGGQKDWLDPVAYAHLM